MTVVVVPYRHVNNWIVDSRIAYSILVIHHKLQVIYRLPASSSLPTGKHTIRLTYYQTIVNKKMNKKALFLATDFTDFTDFLGTKFTKGTKK